jgi:PAS domain-containing protein
VRAEDGEIDGFFCALQEITGQVLAQRRLRESEARAHADAERVKLALAAGAIIGTWFYDIQQDQFAVDEQFANAFGIDPQAGREGLNLADDGDHSPRRQSGRAGGCRRGGQSWRK